MRIFTRQATSLLSLSVLALLAGCASQPSSQAQADAPAAQPMTAKEKVDAALAAGYEIKNENGKTMYCRKEMQTGSHARFKTSCMTEQEWEQLADSSRQTMREISRRRLPPRGT